MESNFRENLCYRVSQINAPQFLLDFSGYKNALKGGIHSFAWSTKTFLYDIREPRYKQIKMGYQTFKHLNIGKSSVLKYDIALIYA